LLLSRRETASAQSRPRRRLGRGRPSIEVERLEPRLALAGDTVIFYVAGFAGATFPQRVIDHVDGLIASGRVENVEYFLTNWNSPDPTTTSGDPGEFPSPVKLVAMALAPSLAPIVIADALANPVTDESFVDSLSSKLQNEYDDDDTIILVGHSFGGDSLLKVANRLQGKRQIDVLATLDPVGFGGLRDNLSSPGSNVKYFFNRWQDIVPFPVDFPDSGRLASGATGSLEGDFQVASQSLQSTRKLADGSPDWHGPTSLELALLAGSPQYFKTTFYDPVTQWRDFEKYPLGKTEAKSLTHEYLPLDEYISKELIRVVSGVIPQKPVVDARVTLEGDTSPDALNRVFEGDVINLDASRSFDYNPRETEQLSFEWRVTESPVFPRERPDSRVAAVTNFVPTDNGEYEVRVTVTDPTGLFDEKLSSPIQVRNVAPLVESLTVPVLGVRGFPVAVQSSFWDPGTNDTHVVSWAFGDGGTFRGPLVKGARAASADHTYESAGAFSVSVSVRDDDGDERAPTTRTVNIVPVGLVPSATKPGAFDLLVGGTAGDDKIQVSSDAVAGRVRVVMNGVDYGAFAVDGRVRIAGQSGDDDITIGDGAINGILSPVDVLGGPGSDLVVVDDSGSTANRDYEVTPTTVRTSDDVGVAGRYVKAGAQGFGGVTYDATTEFLLVDGSGGVNVFNAQPSIATAYSLYGNGPTAGTVEASKGDFLRLDTKTTFPVDQKGFGLDSSGRRLSIESRGNGQWSFTKGTGHKPVAFESIERFNHVDILAAASDAGATSSASVQVFDAETLTPLFTIDAAATYGVGYREGVRVATGDLDNDGLPDVAVAPGRAAAPMIKVFNGSPQAGVQGTEIVGLRIRPAATYGRSYVGGVNIAVGDVSGDTLNDIVLTPSRGRAIVKVFENSLVAGAPYARLGGTAARSFDVFPGRGNYIGGASVATGDVLRVGKKQVVVGSGVGMNGNVRVFDVRTNASSYKSLRTIVDPTLPVNRGGLFVATGDLDGDGHDDIVTGAGAGSGGWVRAYSGRTGSLTFSVATDSRQSATLPTRVAVRAVDGDKRMAVFATWGPDARQGYRTRRIDAQSRSVVDELRLPPSGLSGGGLNVG
jgi:hypothetical protein